MPPTQNLLSTSLTALRNKEEEIISNGDAHQRHLITTDHAEDNRLKPNMGCHDPANKGVLMQNPRK